MADRARLEPATIKLTHYQDRGAANRGWLDGIQMTRGFRYYKDHDLEKMVQLFREGYLTETGWLKSAKLKEALDAQGPIPWMTYPAIEMLRRIARPEMKVFEFGSGASTLWWSQRVASVVAVEHDDKYAAEVASRIIRVNDKVVLRPAGTPAKTPAVEKYLNYVEESPTDTREANSGPSDRDFSGYLETLLEYPSGTFHIVVVDGIVRNTAGAIAAEMVASHGIVVIDNSERDYYRAAYSALRSSGFARIDFWGPGPINPYGWCTSIFARSLTPFST